MIAKCRHLSVSVTQKKNIFCSVLRKTNNQQNTKPPFPLINHPLPPPTPPVPRLFSTWFHSRDFVSPAPSPSMPRPL